MALLRVLYSGAALLAAGSSSCEQEDGSLLQLGTGKRASTVEVSQQRKTHGCEDGAGKQPGWGGDMPGLRISVAEYMEVFARTARVGSAELPLALSQGSEGSVAEGCDQGDVSALTQSEQLLMKDYETVSTWGRMCFDTAQGAADGYAQSLFVLGQKAVSNFEYDYCKFVNEKLMQKEPNFVFGYWARAGCNSQLLWNAEMPEASSELLAEGRKKQKELNIELSAKEEGWYKAFEDLNDYSRDWENCSAPENADTDMLVKNSRPCRFLAFLDDVDSLFEEFPDANSAAYSVLARIAVGVVACTSSVPGECQPLESARALGQKFFAMPEYQSNPALLHFALHSFDYPFIKIYPDGLPFADKYPELVNGSVHSLHMSSHIFQRNGLFQKAAAADQASVTAADQFSVSGALAYQKGEVGELNWTVGGISGYGFAYNAGNLYHSLEYLQYEVLQLCDVPKAAALSERMDVATFQVVNAAGGHAGAENKDIGPAWYAATTFSGWSYRMQGRFAQQAVMFSMLGDVGETAENLPAGSFGGSLPLPLAWSDATEYSNSMYAPQSEAGVWNAIGLHRSLGGKNVAKLFEKAAKGIEADDGPAAGTWEAACGGEGLAGCGDYKVQMALQRIGQAQEHYATAEIWYEANLTAALKKQVGAAAALAAGKGKLALKLAEDARDLEISGVQALLPSSSSVYFIPGDAFHGILALGLAKAGMSESKDEYKSESKNLQRSLYKSARESFLHCLSPQGRPNLAICLLGMARVSEALGKTRDAKKYYGQLLKKWKGSSAPEEGCDKAFKEAEKVTDKYD